MPIPEDELRASEGDAAEGDDNELTPAQLAELRRRIKSIDSGQSRSISFDDVMQEILSKFKPAPPQ